ncbi:MAG: hypothetical protein ACRDTC_21820 [Pseudonocardiaceae bacterium]
MGSVSWRACAALYSLVEEHPVDRRGRCRSCRGPGALLGWGRRRCQVRVWACFWLHQPDETLLLGLLARELDQHSASSPGVEEQADPVPQTLTVPRPPPSDGGCLQARGSAPNTSIASSVVRCSDRPSTAE